MKSIILKCANTMIMKSACGGFQTSAHLLFRCTAHRLLTRGKVSAVFRRDSLICRNRLRNSFLLQFISNAHQMKHNLLIAGLRAKSGCKKALHKNIPAASTRFRFPRKLYMAASAYPRRVTCLCRHVLKQCSLDFLDVPALFPSSTTACREVSTGRYTPRNHAPRRLCLDAGG